MCAPARPSLPPPAARRGRQFGLTLVEWLVSITLGSFLLVALLQLVAQQSQTQAELDRSSRQIENGRYAVELLADDLQLAGYYGELGSTNSITTPTALPAPCDLTAAGLAAALPFPVQGYNAPGSTLPFACAGGNLVAANHLDGTDILVVRRADTSLGVSGSLVVGQAYLQTGLLPPTNAFTHRLDVAAASALNTTTFPLKKKDGTTAAPMRPFVVHIYYVSPCNVPTSGSTCSQAGTDDGGTSIPTLKRLELTASGGAAVFSVVPLVEGIENFQIDYGIDSDGDGAPNSYVTTPAAVADWANVMALRLNLLARNTERSPGHTDTATYNLGLAGNTTATNDAFKRRAFSQLVRLVNPSGRRDS